MFIKTKNDKNKIQKKNVQKLYIKRSLQIKYCGMDGEWFLHSLKAIFEYIS